MSNSNFKLLYIYHSTELLIDKKIYQYIYIYIYREKKIVAIP